MNAARGVRQVDGPTEKIADPAIAAALRKKIGALLLKSAAGAALLTAIVYFLPA